MPVNHQLWVRQFKSVPKVSKKKKKKGKIRYYINPPTCTCVLLKLVSPVHHLFMPLGAVLPFPASSFRFHLTDVKCAPEPGDC